MSALPRITDIVIDDQGFRNLPDTPPCACARDVDVALRRGGFIMVHQRGSHRYYASPVTDNVITTVPMHAGDLKRPLLKKIIRDIRLSEAAFRKLL
jgi:predicted RNA binding protein YcfA (HicA-like mRNA interferase family)